MLFELTLSVMDPFASELANLAENLEDKLPAPDECSIVYRDFSEGAYSMSILEESTLARG